MRRFAIRVGAFAVLASANAGCAPSAPIVVERSDPTAPAPTAVVVVPTASASAVIAPLAKEPSVAVLPQDYDFSKNPGAELRIAESPHHYYRFINQPFSALVCHRFAERIKTMPRVALHGDAHIEQYAVTDLGRGLTDLDDTSIGPPLVDLLRIGTSLVIAIHEKTVLDATFRGHEAEVLAELFRGYRQGIADPQKLPPASELDKRLEKKFIAKRLEFLDATEKLLLPVSNPTAQAEAMELHKIYEERMLQTYKEGPKNKAFSATMFALKKMGTIRIGIGSALDERYVFRLEGPTSSADDDMIVELKRERSPEDPACLTALRDYSPSRYLMGPISEKHFAPMVLPDKPFWAGEWYANYKEVRIDKTIESLDDLKSVAFESGFVLGRGHVLSAIESTTKTAPSKEAVNDTKKALTPSDAFETELDDESMKLAVEVEAGFAAFRAATTAPPH